MKTLLFFSATLVAAVVSAALGAQTADVAGSWELTLEMDQKSVTKTYTFEQTGEKIVVKWTRGGEAEQAEGTVKGGKIEWSTTGKINGREFKIVYTGSVEGPKMTGEVDFGGQASYSWKAVKKS